MRVSRLEVLEVWFLGNFQPRSNVPSLERASRSSPDPPSVESNETAGNWEEPDIIFCDDPLMPNRYLGSNAIDIWMGVP